ncbi:DUF6682 family protein [Desulfospira joergensenii]|uniref:phage adaptor protein n=1 Tax=Desulfospira joergensenii TaxID=53329 RepID=UPI0003B62D90|nr:DUF6682 family protein [Desulfospira joergensenii]
MTTASDIITNDLEKQLNDTGQIFWEKETLFKYTTEAQNACILLGVDANIVTSDFNLAQSSRQVLPSGGIRFVDIEGNVGGGPVTRVKKQTMDECCPGWQSETTDSEIEHFLFDEEQPMVFWVYKKPSVNTLQVLLSFAQAAPLITSMEDPLVLSDIYVPAVKEYILWRCFSQEDENTAIAVANQHLSNFFTFLGKKYQGIEILKAIMKNG